MLDLDFTSVVIGMMIGCVVVILIEWIYMFGGKK